MYTFKGSQLKYCQHFIDTKRPGDNVWAVDQTAVNNLGSCCRLAVVRQNTSQSISSYHRVMAIHPSSDTTMPSKDRPEIPHDGRRRFKNILPLWQQGGDDSRTINIAVGGHRGFGANVWSSEGPQRSYKYRENTISSFLAAIEAGATFIEFDVQVTSDGVAVLFHDNFLVYGHETNPSSTLIKDIDLYGFKGASPANSTIDGNSGSVMVEGGSDDEVASAPPQTTWPMLGGESSISYTDESDMIQGDSPKSIVAIEGLAMPKTLLRQHKNGIVASPSDKSLSAWKVYEEDQFPTLAEVFEEIPRHIGFDIEIKMATEDDLVKTHDEEITRVVDTILSTIDALEAHAALEGFPKRPLVFSSFDPDVCSLVKSRRPSDTVMFLSTGGTSWHADPRRMSIQAAIEFATSNHLQGIIVDSGALFAHKDTVAKAKARGLVTMTYGLENDDPQWVAAQHELQVHGIIVDDVERISRHFLSS